MANPRRRSKKPSATSSAGERLSSLLFFLDRSIEAESLYRALVAAGARVERHNAHFRHDELDEVWLAEAAARGWVILTRDRRIRYRPLEKQAVIASGARLFSVVAGNLSGGDLANLLVGQLPRIVSLAGAVSGGSSSERSFDRIPWPANGGFRATLQSSGLRTIALKSAAGRLTLLHGELKLMNCVEG